MKSIKRVYILLVMAIGIVLTSCVSPWALRIQRTNNIIWYSEEPVIEFSVTEFANGVGYGFLIDDDERIEIIFYYFAPTLSFTIYLVEDNEIKNILIDGFFNKHNDGVELEIINDYVFSNQYLSIILKHRPLDDTEPKEYIKAIWTSSTLNLKIYITEIRYSGFGLMTVSDEEKSIYFKWCDSNRFEIYLSENDNIDEVAVISGYYVRDGKNVLLTIEENLLSVDMPKTANMLVSSMY